MKQLELGVPAVLSFLAPAHAKETTGVWLNDATRRFDPALLGQ